MRPIVLFLLCFFIKIVYLFFDLLDLLHYGLFALLYGQTVFGIMKIIALLVLHLTLANKNRTMKCKLCLGKLITAQPRQFVKALYRATWAHKIVKLGTVQKE